MRMNDGAGELANLTSFPGRFAAASGARIGHGMVLAVLNQAALVVPLVALAPRLLGEGDPFDAHPASFLLLAVIIFLQAGLVVWLGLLRFGRVSLRELGWRTDDLASNVLRGLGAGVVVVAIVGALRYADGGVEAVAATLDAVRSYSIAQRVLFLAIGIVAAFAEESIFRGYLQPSLIERWGNIAGIVSTAAFFAVYHLRFTPIGLSGLFLYGLIYGALRGRARSLFAPAVAHAFCWAALGPV